MFVPVKAYAFPALYTAPLATPLTPTVLRETVFPVATTIAPTPFAETPFVVFDVIMFPVAVM